MTLYLYGIIEQPRAIDFGPIGFDQGEVRAIPQGPLAAVVGQSPAQELNKITRDELLKSLLSHQRTIELVMKKGFFVLPFKFATSIRDEKEGLRILTEEKGVFLDKMAQFKNCVEIDLVATWDVKEMLRELSETDPEIVSSKKQGIRDLEQRVFIGKLLANALKRRAGQWKEELQEFIKAYAQDVADHNLLNDEMVLNCSFLVRREEEKAFYGAVEKADLALGKKLTFKCVGPLPPHSFATMTLKRFDPQKVAAAARLLGLNGEVELTFVKKVYKELSRRCHPDTNPNLSMEKFEELNRAYEILVDYCEDGPKLLEKAAIEKSARLEIMENLGQVHHAA